MDTRIEEIVDNFAFLDDWEDRYRYVLDLGKELPPLSEDEHSEGNKVRGCASQVWFVSEIGQGENPEITFRGDSDAHLVRGLIAILLALYSGKPAKYILETDADALFARIGLREHLTAQRSNGLSSMVQRIRRDAGSTQHRDQSSSMVGR